MSYPLCKKHNLLKSNGRGGTALSTTALYELIGNEKYQQVRKRFVYRGNYPDPENVEEFLRKNLK